MQARRDLPRRIHPPFRLFLLGDLNKGHKKESLKTILLRPHPSWQKHLLKSQLFNPANLRRHALVNT